MCTCQKEKYDSTSCKDVEIKQDAENYFNARDVKNFKVLQTTACHSYALSKLVMSCSTIKEGFSLAFCASTHHMQWNNITLFAM